MTCSLPWLPSGVELDVSRGKAIASVVGFEFRNTRVLGLSIPGHRDFPEVNLRFYVRRWTGEEWRRGVVFVKELVPRWAIAWTARRLYGERYETARMNGVAWHVNGEGKTSVLDDERSLLVARRRSVGRALCGSERRTEAGLGRLNGGVHHGPGLRVFVVWRRRRSNMR